MLNGSQRRRNRRRMQQRIRAVVEDRRFTLTLAGEPGSDDAPATPPTTAGFTPQPDVDPLDAPPLAC